MDQEKIGAFITECRKQAGLTQAALGEQLGITDRAVSKWERGKSMPDPSLMLPLCGLLHITVNELLTGERISMEDYQKKAEEKLLELQKQEALNMGVIATFCGIWGVAAGTAVLIYHLATLKCLGVRFLTPYPSGRGLLRRRLKNQKERDPNLNPVDKKNQQ